VSEAAPPGLRPSRVGAEAAVPDLRRSRPKAVASGRGSKQLAPQIGQAAEAIAIVCIMISSWERAR
jgi:hypothetical protein